MKPLLVFGLMAIATVALGVLSAEPGEHLVVKKPFGQHWDKAAPKSGGTQILYHGGAILLGTVPVYLIYYGDFQASTKDILNDFFTGLGGSAQFDVNTTYYDGTPAYISGLLNYSAANVFLDSAASQGTQVNSNTVLKILQHALAPSTPNHLPVVDGAVYFVLPAPGIKVAGFCTSFCAYHSSSRGIVSGHTIRYALVPDPGTRQKCTACDGNFSLGEAGTPNGDPGADEMTDSIMHELSETVTDPDGGGWFTSNGAENGDLCNYNYGAVQKHAGISYNASWLGRRFLIQTIWENQGAGFCANTVQ